MSCVLQAAVCNFVNYCKNLHRLKYCKRHDKWLRARFLPGPRVRRIRNGLSLTQTAMAEALGISPSYLNLIERNQRPLTVQLLLKLASVYKVDLDELQGEGGRQRRAVARGVCRSAAGRRDAGRSGTDRGGGGCAQCRDRHGQALSRLSRAGRAAEGSERPSGGQGHMAALSDARLPMDEVREVLERRPHYFAAIDEAAEAFHARLSRRRRSRRRTEGLAAERSMGSSVRTSAGACHAESAPSLRPSFHAAVPVGAAVRS